MDVDAIQHTRVSLPVVTLDSCLRRDGIDIHPYSTPTPHSSRVVYAGKAHRDWRMETGDWRMETGD